jgi:predicted dehydrogenase
LGVVGVGHLGQHHARILSTLPGVQLIGVVDLIEQRARDVAASTGVAAFTDAAQLAGRVDALVVAVPADSHAAVARPFLQAGVSVLVEKPMARSTAEGDQMIAAAAASGAVLAVGHTERYNPAVSAALPLIEDPRFIEVHRLGAFPDRSLDIDVIFDVMIHDLDIVLSVVDSDVVSIEAVGVPVLTGRVDIANARLAFASGCVANVTASRISRDRVRKIRVFQPDAYISIDCGTQEADVYRLARPPAGRPVIQGGRLEVAREEPLTRELADFVGAVRDHRQPVVTGRDGRRAVDLAARIAERIGDGRSAARST